MARPSHPDGPGFAARSDVGLMRTGNEDRFLARPPIFAVADGMGGHQAGEVASGVAIELLDETADRTPAPSTDDVVDDHRAVERSDPARGASAGRACRHGHDLHRRDRRCDDPCRPRRRQSGLPASATGELIQLTDDHSLVASMVRDGLIAPADARDRWPAQHHHPGSRGRGPGPGRRRHLRQAPGRPASSLCSDGLHGQVDDAAIAAVLARRDRTRRTTADRLVGLANAAGGDDNVTVIVIDPDALAALAAQVQRHRRRDPRCGHRRDRREWRRSAPPADGDGASGTSAAPIPLARVALLVILVVAIVALAIASWLWLRRRPPRPDGRPRPGQPSAGATGGLRTSRALRPGRA